MIEGGKVGRRKRKEGVKTMPSGSEEPLNIFLKKSWMQTWPCFHAIDQVEISQVSYESI